MVASAPDNVCPVPMFSRRPRTSPAASKSAPALTVPAKAGLDPSNGTFALRRSSATKPLTSWLAFSPVNPAPWPANTLAGWSI
jgi:hypothetical protein